AFFAQKDQHFKKRHHTRMMSHSMNFTSNSTFECIASFHMLITSYEPSIMRIGVRKPKENQKDAK
ncbi:hypothetical protein DD606_25275, partial [Enterobacter cloacae complex sp. GF14B]